MARVRVLAWRGIPAQVKARDDSGRRVSRQLPDWFAQEIDRVAMRDGITGTDAYLAEWAWGEEEERPGGAEDVATAVAAELAAEWGHPAGSEDTEPAG